MWELGYHYDVYLELSRDAIEACDSVSKLLEIIESGLLDGIHRNVVSQESPWKTLDRLHNKYVGKLIGSTKGIDGAINEDGILKVIEAMRCQY